MKENGIFFSYVGNYFEKFLTIEQPKEPGPYGI